MAVVHVFFSTSRFGTHGALRAFVDPTYTEHGEAIASPFMREVGIVRVEPACIEVEAGPVTQPIRRLLAGASYASRWLGLLPDSVVANEAICVFEPNEVGCPSAASSVTYCGSYTFSSE